MTSPIVTFLSYNATGMNTVKAEWIRDLLKVTDSHFVGIQEHFMRAFMNQYMPKDVDVGLLTIDLGPLEVNFGLWKSILRL